MISSKLVAIDFGSSRISAMAAEVLEDGSIRVLSEESKPSDDIKYGIIEKASGAAFKVNELIKLLQNSAKIPDILNVSASIGARTMKHVPMTVSRFVAKPNIVTDELLADMLEECEKKSQRPDVTVYDVIPVSYLLDGKYMDDPVGQKAIQVTAKYHVVLGSAVINSELDRCFDRTSIFREYCPLSIESVSTVITDEAEREAGCAIVNLGAATTTLSVYHDGVLQYLTVVPLGAGNITKDIAELGIDEADAERLKCLKGCATEAMVADPVYIQVPSRINPGEPVRISTRFLATIIEARLEEILQPVIEIIDKLPFALDAGIVLTGGGSKLAGVLDFLVEKTGIYTRFGDHSDWLSDDTSEKYADPVYTQLVGTLVLANEYRKEHPIEVQLSTQKIKVPTKNKKWEKLANGFINFFGDENKMN
ncbi:MAG TPA: cell division protein FtsA [Paludibacter sp.]|nr:cell division protein FtsA [Paludibacter sp.]